MRPAFPRALKLSQCLTDASAALGKGNPLLCFVLCNVPKCPWQSRVRPPEEEMNQF